MDQPQKLAVGKSQPPGLAPPPGLFFPPTTSLPSMTSVQKNVQALSGRGGSEPLSLAPASLAHQMEESMSEQSLASEELARLSLGSVGHPHSCAGACRYIKRKGGCRDGANCPHCHLCFWRRTADVHEGPQAPDSEKSEAFISVGTRGHPHQCGPPCRYVRRKGGCRDGANCTSCHACLWQRDRQELSQEHPSPLVPPVPPVPETCFAAAIPDERANIFGDSSQTLQGLIAELLRQGMRGDAKA
jgi:hypothetical protein